MARWREEGKAEGDSCCYRTPRLASPAAWYRELTPYPSRAPRESSVAVHPPLGLIVTHIFGWTLGVP